MSVAILGDDFGLRPAEYENADCSDAGKPFLSALVDDLGFMVSLGSFWFLFVVSFLVSL